MSMDTEKYRCPVCWDMHEKDTMCPVVWNKVKNCKKQSFILGSIFLECIKKKKDFISILNEMIYYLAFFEMNMHKSIRTFNIELFLDYFAIELDCSPDKFRKDVNTLEREYIEYFGYQYWKLEESYVKNKRYLLYIPDIKDIMPFDISKYNISRKYMWMREPRLILKKEKNDSGQWEYYLALEYRLEYNMEEFKVPGCEDFLFYYFVDQEGLNDEIILLKTESGELADYFEKEFSYYWKDIAEDIFYTDVRYDLWIKKLRTVTLNKVLEWNKSEAVREEIDLYGNPNVYEESRYYTVYQNKEINFICAKRNEPEETIFTLYIRYDRENTFKFLNYVMEDGVRIFDDKERLKQFNDCINRIINGQDKQITNKNLPVAMISSVDVIIRSFSMFCEHNNHMIKSVVGRIPIMNGSEIISYEVYLGYCTSCGVYLMFPSDYEKIISLGVPQCKLYISFWEKEKSEEKFLYNSKSILRKKGYNVQDKNGLPERERQRILLNVIEEQLMTSYEVIMFLNWLVNTRKSQSKYQLAVKKWREDIKYVKNLVKDSEKVDIKSITGRINKP